MQPHVTLSDARVLAVLQQLRDIAGPAGSRIMQRAGRYMLTSMRMRFLQQAGPDGQRWWASRRAASEGGETLRDSGRLLHSLTWRAGGDYAEAGTNLIYAAGHQFGMRKVVNVRAHRRMRRRRYGEGASSVVSSPVRSHVRLMFLPARPFAGFSSRDRDEILTILRQGIADLAKR